MIVRHAEKPTTSNEQLGIRPNGEHNRHSLSVRGWIRAGALVGLFAPQHGEPRAGSGATRRDLRLGPRGRRGHRPVQTVTPLAERLGKHIHSGCGAGRESEVAAKLAARRGAVLVSWHHEAIPKLVGELGAAAPAVPQHWPGDRFDVGWTLTRDGTGWEFGQVPQLLLAGDLPDPIG